jgi:hypothetical protein
MSKIKPIHIVKTFFSLFNLKVLLWTFLICFIPMKSNWNIGAQFGTLERMLLLCIISLMCAIPLSFIVGTIQYLKPIWKEVKAKKNNV